MRKIVLGVWALVGLSAFADELPEGYEAVEYIAADGAQYVDTGVVGQEGLTASVDFMYTRDTSRCILGASEGGVTLTLSAPEHAAVKVRHQVETTFPSIAGSRTFYLFARNDAGAAADCAFARIYGARLCVGETVLRDYVPCREVSSGTYGLYELKEGVFRPSQGAKPFFRPWRVGVFTGRGATGAVMSWCQLIDRSPWLDLTILSPTLAQKSATFDSLDAVVFPGGTAGTQYSSLGASGRTNVKNFVRNGGCYYGTCAGFHLVLNDMLDMSGYRYLCSADRHERVNVRLTDDCKAALGLTQEVWSLGYSAGPLSTAGTAVEGANLTVWGRYETDIVGPNNVQMNGKPAILAGTYFDGRMFVTASHPEFYFDTTPLITRGFRWLSGRDDIVVDDYGDDYVEGRMNVFLDTTYSGISSLAATVLKVNNDPRMNLVKGATSTYVDSSTYKANGRVALYPTGVLGTEASGSSASKTAIAAFKRRGGLCLYEDDGLSGDDVWALVDAVERDTRTEKSLAWGAGNALAFAGDRTVTGQDLRVTADGMYVTTFEDGDIAFEANGEGLGGDWAYCCDAVTHRVVIDNARVRAVHGNHRRNSQMTATTAGAYSPVANQAFEITLGDRNAALPTLAFAAGSNAVEAVQIVRTAVNGVPLEKAKTVFARYYHNNVAREEILVPEDFVRADFIGLDKTLAADYEGLLVRSVTYEIRIGGTNGTSRTLNYSASRDKATVNAVNGVTAEKATLSFTVPTDTVNTRFWLKMDGNVLGGGRGFLLPAAAAGAVTIDLADYVDGLTAGRHEFSVALGNDLFGKPAADADWCAAATQEIGAAAARTAGFAVKVLHPTAADADLAGGTVVGYEECKAALRTLAGEIDRRHATLAGTCSNLRASYNAGRLANGLGAMPVVAVFIDNLDALVRPGEKEVHELLGRLSQAWHEGFYTIATAKDYTRATFKTPRNCNEFCSDKMFALKVGNPKMFNMRSASEFSEARQQSQPGVITSPSCGARMGREATLVRAADVADVIAIARSADKESAYRERVKRG